MRFVIKKKLTFDHEPAKYCMNLVCEKENTAHRDQLTLPPGIEHSLPKQVPERTQFSGGFITSTSTTVV